MEGARAERPMIMSFPGDFSPRSMFYSTRGPSLSDDFEMNDSDGDSDCPKYRAAKTPINTVSASGDTLLRPAFPVLKQGAPSQAPAKLAPLKKVPKNRPHYPEGNPLTSPDLGIYGHALTIEAEKAPRLTPTPPKASPATPGQVRPQRVYPVPPPPPQRVYPVPPPPPQRVYPVPPPPPQTGSGLLHKRKAKHHKKRAAMENHAGSVKKAAGEIATSNTLSREHALDWYKQMKKRIHLS